MLLKNSKANQLLVVLIMTIVAPGTFLFLINTASSVRAAPHQPVVLNYPTSFTITGTKYTTPISTVTSGTCLTYTIVFTADSQTGTVVVTDPVPINTSFAGIITGAPAISITANVLNNTMVWTATDVVTNTVISLTATVKVDVILTNNLTITNIAWLSDSTGIIPTNQMIHTVAVSQTIYLPIIMKPEDTILTVVSSNTGDFVVEIRKISDNSLVITCNVSNNSSVVCGSFPPGTYNFSAIGTQCGSVTVPRTFSPGPKTIPVSC